MMSAVDDLYIAPLAPSTDTIKSVEALPDRYTVTFETAIDPETFIEQTHEDTTQYEVITGETWGDASPSQYRDPATLQESEPNILHLKEESTERYNRSYYESCDRDPREIMITVPVEDHQYSITPLYPALEPFFDDDTITETVQEIKELFEGLDEEDAISL